MTATPRCPNLHAARQRHPLRAFPATLAGAALALTVLSGAACAQAPASVPGAAPLQVITVEHYPQLDVRAREFYVTGLLDADRVFVQQSHPQFDRCLMGLTPAQVTAAVDRALPTLPPVKRVSMPIALHNVLFEICAQRGVQVGGN